MSRLHRHHSRGLLIVNADDWGLDAASTDSALECWRRGGLTSATAMVWMRDSARAAQIAEREPIPLGLHLNLIEPYTADDVPDDARIRQRKVAERVRAGGGRPLLFDALYRHEIERCVADQLAEFERLYGRRPTHVDGHRHMHLSLAAVLSRSLAHVGRYRIAFTFFPSESPLPKRAVRAALNRIIASRYCAPRYLFSIRTLHPALGGRDMEKKLALAATHPVEVMVHPARADEFDILTGAPWTERLSTLRHGSYLDL